MQLVNGFSLSLMLLLAVILCVLVDQVTACGGKGGKGMGKGMGKGKKFGKFGKEKFGKKKFGKVKSVGTTPYSAYEKPYALTRPHIVEVPVYRPRYVEQEYFVEPPPARRQVTAPNPHSRRQPESFGYSEHHQGYDDYLTSPPASSYELHNRNPPSTYPPADRPSFRKELGRAIRVGLVKALSK